MKIIKDRFKQLFALVLLAGMITYTGCSDSGLTESKTGMGTLEVRLHDAPANYDEVNIFIERVEVNNEEGDEGWQVISEPQEQYNLLELTNGVFEVIGSAELEAGFYPQIRLILSRDNNNVVIDGEEHNLFIPSGAQTGVKLNVDAEIEDGIQYTLLLDFDAMRSVVKTGQAPFPGFILKPVIRATNASITGNIGGTVLPVEARAAIYAISGSDTLSTTFADTTNGEFLLVGLQDGLYDVSVEPRTEEYDGTNISDVEVEVGETTDLETIELEPATE